MVRSLDTLLAALDSKVRPGEPRAGGVLVRDLLDLLLAASDLDVIAAVVQRPWLWDEVLLDAPVRSPPADQARVESWRQQALRTLLGRTPTHQARPLLEALGQRRAPGLIAQVGDCMRLDPLRARAAPLLRQFRTPEAWALLRQHDGPDLDLALRFEAILHDPVRPRPALDAFLGASADLELRRWSLRFVLTQPDDLLRADDLLDLLDLQLDHGFGLDTALLCGRLARLADLSVYRRLFRSPRTPPRTGKHGVPLAVRNFWKRSYALPRDPVATLLALLRSPLRPRPGLQDFFGPGAAPDLYRWSLHFVLTQPDDVLQADDLLELFARHLDARPGPDNRPDDHVDGVPLLLERLSEHTTAAVRRWLFDRLWPLAQAGQSPWPSVDLYHLFVFLVRTAPVPDLLASLLDVRSPDDDRNLALLWAIAPRPDPHLVPALARWAADPTAASVQAAAVAALATCRSAPPWPG